MANYIIRRILQAIPQLVIISIILFALMQAFGDPIATLGGRIPPCQEDRERLRRQLGLDQPVYKQYLTWLIGNDWQKVDMDGDGYRPLRHPAAFGPLPGLPVIGPTLLR